MVKDIKWKVTEKAAQIVNVFKVFNLSISDKLFLEDQSHNLGLKLACFFINDNTLNYSC